jgi:NAD(P)-dependent dehydrogenase (short-subunit alcohol dehydrogenase family)
MPHLPEANVIDRFRLDGRTALVTGGGRGIGRTIALVYAGAGANVAVVSRTEKQVREVRQEVESLGVRGSAIVADISDPADVRRMAGLAFSEFGSVDILVNNAGNLPYKPLAHEWASYNVTVNAISPGHFHTEMSAELHENPKSREWMMKRIPMRREGELYELGAVALYLASDLGSYVTGQEIFIDGGETL